MQTQIHNEETTKSTEQNINLKVSFHSLQGINAYEN